jgi:hypothetical protein
MNLKNKLKLGASLLAGTTAIYIAERFGITEFLVNLEISKQSIFGDSVKNFAEYLSPLIRVSADLGIGSLGMASAFFGMEF